MAKRYKTKDADAPYGMTRAGVPRKRPGVRKGVEKTPDSGRSKIPIEEQLDSASDALALAVISGEPIHQYGATGKAYTAPANLSLRQKFAEVWWNRRRPTLVASQIKAEVKSEVIRTDPPDPRSLARSVLTVLEHAKLADKPSDPAASPAPGQLLLGRDDVIEIAASDPRGVTAVALQGEASGHAELLDAAPDRNGAAREASSDHADASPESNDGADGERTIFDNGAEVIYDAELGKFAVLDSGGELHGYRRSRALAETFAATLPGPAAMTAVGQKRT